VTNHHALDEHKSPNAMIHAHGLVCWRLSLFDRKF